MVLKKTLASPFDSKEIKPVNPKGNYSWIFTERADAETETPIFWPPQAKLTHWKRLRCWEGLGAGGEGDYRGWDGWMASLTRWTWVWVNSGSWCWTGRPGELLIHGVAKSWTRLSDWTELKGYLTLRGCITTCAIPIIFRNVMMILCFYFDRKVIKLLFPPNPKLSDKMTWGKTLELLCKN